jgi:hypothetical protein
MDPADQSLKIINTLHAYEVGRSVTDHQYFILSSFGRAYVFIMLAVFLFREVVGIGTMERSKRSRRSFYGSDSRATTAISHPNPSVELPAFGTANRREVRQHRPLIAIFILLKQNVKLQSIVHFI